MVTQFTNAIGETGDGIVFKSNHLLIREALAAKVFGVKGICPDKGNLTFVEVEVTNDFSCISRILPA